MSRERRALSSELGILSTHAAVFVSLGCPPRRDRGRRDERVASKGDKGSGAERTDSAGLTGRVSVELLIHTEC